MSKEDRKEAIRSIRFSDTDDLLISNIKAKTGISATSEVMRMALRALAEKLDVEVVIPTSRDKP